MDRRSKREKDRFFEKSEAASGGPEEKGGYIEGKNEVLEVMRSGRTVDRLYMADGVHDGKLDTIRREAKKAGVRIDFVDKKRLDDMSGTGRHQGVMAKVASYSYAEVEDLLEAASAKGEDPFLFILDGIEDPHNLGAIIRTANQAGAHGVIIPKDRAVGLTATVSRASAGALEYTPVAKVTNLARTVEMLKDRGLWIAAADMDGDVMYEKDLRGPIALVIGGEGDGVSRLLREKSDYVVSIPLMGDIDSLNASVACGILAYEVVRQRRYGGRGDA